MGSVVVEKEEEEEEEGNVGDGDGHGRRRTWRSRKIKFSAKNGTIASYDTTLTKHQSKDWTNFNSEKKFMLQKFLQEIFTIFCSVQKLNAIASIHRNNTNMASHAEWSCSSTLVATSSIKSCSKRASLERM